MSRPARSSGPQAAGLRRVLLAKVHVAKKQLGLDEPEYRALLAAHGVESSAQLSPRSLEGLLEHFRELGWQEAPRKAAAKDPKPKTMRPESPQDARIAMLYKVEAMLAEKGRKEGTYVPWSYAVAILQRQCGVERLEWASPEQLAAVIAALDRDAKRKGRRTA